MKDSEKKHVKDKGEKDKKRKKGSKKSQNFTE